MNRALWNWCCRKTVSGVALLSLMLAIPASAHDAGIAEIFMDWPAKVLRAELDMLDLDFALNIDSDRDGEISAGDVYASTDHINQYVAESLAVAECSVSQRTARIGIRNGVRPRVVAETWIDCPRDMETVTLRSSLLAEIPGYRTIMQVANGDGSRLYELVDGRLTFEISQAKWYANLLSFVTAGVYHILMGLDHLVFLLLLILPIANKNSLRERFVAIAAIVTAFTVAHSITLTFSSLGFLALPSRPVELLIAASIVLVAVLNITGRIRPLAWPVAYVFGLIHGFGFAGAFGELASSEELTLENIIAFNLGVEIGQLAVVAGALVVLGRVSRLRNFQRIVVPVASFAAGGVGVAWLLERM